MRCGLEPKGSSLSCLRLLAAAKQHIQTLLLDLCKCLHTIAYTRRGFTNALDQSFRDGSVHVFVQVTAHAINSQAVQASFISLVTLLASTPNLLRSSLTVGAPPQLHSVAADTLLHSLQHSSGPPSHSHTHNMHLCMSHAPPRGSGCLQPSDISQASPPSVTADTITLLLLVDTR